MSRLVRDLQYAWRALVRAPGFAGVAVVTLALGIGANTAIFTVVDRVLLRPLSFRDADRLVRITSDVSRVGGQDIGLGPVELEDMRGPAGIFTDAAGVYPINVNLTGGSEPERVEAQLISANFFTLLGVHAQEGRLFDATDGQPGNTELAVISDSLWTRRFNRDRAAIGRAVRVDNDPYQIVGVLPAGFRYPGRSLIGEPEVYGPSGYSAKPFNPPARGNFLFAGAIARLRPGLSVDDAQTHLAEFGAKLRAEFPKEYPAAQGWAPRLIPLQQDLIGHARSGLLLLLAAVGAVLLIACANVANLLLARAARRQREFGVRGAMGATRADLVRQVLTESVLLGVIGGGAGVILSLGLVRGLSSLVPAGLAGATDVLNVDARVLAFSVLLSLATGLLFGVVPALQASPTQPYEILKDSARAVSASPRRTRVRAALVVVEFALALVLLMMSALLGRSFLRLYAVDPGFSADRVLTAGLWMPIPNDTSTAIYLKPDRRNALFRQTLDKLRDTPGVEQAGWTARLPIGGARPNSTFMIDGRPFDPANVNTLEPQIATPGYFDVLHIQLVRGRLLSDADNETAPPVVVVSEGFVKKYLPGDEAIGTRIRLGGPYSQAPWQTIVGIVRDVRSAGLQAEPAAQMYRSVWQASGMSMALVVRTAGPPAAFEVPVRQAIRAVDPDLPLFGVKPMTDVIAASVDERRFSMLMFGLFAGAALILSAIGIYGVLSYVVQQRTSEFGLRVALGASRGSIVALVMRHGLMMAASGVALGLVGAAFATRAIASQLFGVGALDVPTFVAVAITMSGVALLACLVPAWRATRIDPLAALRQE